MKFQKRNLLLPLVLFTGFLGFAELLRAAEPPAKEKFHLFLLAGQSNMAGRGQVGPNDLIEDPRILMLTRDGEWKPAIDPIHYDKPVAGVGLAKSFAKVLAEKDETIVLGLIPAACGGSSITTWVPGGYHNQTKSHPYDDAIARAKIAMRDGVLKGILWHQGESDSKPGFSEFYEIRLRQLIARFRKDLDRPDLPMVIGQLGEFPDKPWTANRIVVNDAHQTVARELAKVAFVTSEGLSPKGDNVHFDTLSLKEFGRRYANAYLDITDSK